MMAYEIDYASDGRKRKVSPKRVKPLWAVVILAFAVAIMLSYFVGGRLIPLLPPEAQTTLQAVETMVDDLREGEKISDALTGFCQTIIENG